MSSSWDEHRRPNISDRDTAVQTKWVKPMGVVQRVEPSSARDRRKSSASNSASFSMNRRMRPRMSGGVVRQSNWQGVKVKVPNIQGSAHQNDPKSCTRINNDPREALIGEWAGQVWSCEIRTALQSVDAIHTMRKATCYCSICENGNNSAQPETLDMPRNTLHGNWESPCSPARKKMAGCIGKSKDASQ